MKRSAIAASAVLMVALLAGCSAPAEPTPVDEAASPTVPLTAETPSTEAEGGDAAYLAAVREALPADTVIPNATDDQLLEAGERACKEIAAGTDVRTLSLIDGEQPNGLGTYNDSAVIIGSARASLCD